MKKLNVILFTQTMATLLKSSLSLQDALQVCRDIVEDKKLKIFCEVIIKKINEGYLLSDSLSYYEKFFPKMYISLLNIGEKSGTLTDVFQKLSIYLKQKKEIQNKIIQSLIYPLIVMVTAIIVVFVILFFVFPRLEDIFFLFSENSPEIANNILRTKSGVIGIVNFIFILFFVLFLFIYGHTTKGKMREFADRLMLKIPFIKKIILAAETHEFSFSMKLLTSAYFPFVESLRLASLTVNNYAYKKAVSNVHKKVEQGYGISKAFREEKIFPGYLITWIGIAEKNGDAEGVFQQVYEYYVNETSNILATITAGVEPFFILITGILIMLLVGQFVIPIFKILGGM